jgi:hypothetical protein
VEGERVTGIDELDAACEAMSSESEKYTASRGPGISMDLDSTTSRVGPPLPIMKTHPAVGQVEEATIAR